MDPDFLLQIVELYLTYAPSEVRLEPVFLLVAIMVDCVILNLSYFLGFSGPDSSDPVVAWKDCNRKVAGSRTASATFQYTKLNYWRSGRLSCQIQR